MSEFTCSECGCEWDYCDDPGGFACPECDVDVRYGPDMMSRLDELYGISGDDGDDDDDCDFVEENDCLNRTGCHE